MKLIYKCLLCGMARAELSMFDLPAEQLLNVAYDPHHPLRITMPVRMYGPHECGNGITGVAQLVGVES